MFLNVREFPLSSLSLSAHPGPRTNMEKIILIEPGRKSQDCKAGGTFDKF